MGIFLLSGRDSDAGELPLLDQAGTAGPQEKTKLRFGGA